MRLVLREDRDVAHARVHAVREHEVDDAEFAAEVRRGLAAMVGQLLEPLASAAGHDDRQRMLREPAYIAPRRYRRGRQQLAGLGLIHSQLRWRVSNTIADR